jgi:hypothetical protein
VKMACRRSSVIERAVSFKTAAGQPLSFSDLDVLNQDAARALGHYLQLNSGDIWGLKRADLTDLIELYGLDLLQMELDATAKKKESALEWRKCRTCRYDYQDMYNTAKSCPIPNKDPSGLCRLCRAEVFYGLCTICPTVWRQHIPEETRDEAGGVSGLGRWA